MQAIVYSEYGPPDVLQLREIDKPAPKDNEALIRIYATTINYGDLIARRFKDMSPREFHMPAPLWLLSRVAFGFNKPKKAVLGNELAGVIEAVGKDVRRFKVGDQVFGYPGQDMGAYAEYRCMAESGMVARKPANMSFAEAATVPYGALTALALLRKVNIQSGQKVLINGASGGIGSYALQLAKSYGAEVTGVCGTPRIEMVKALGADKVIDYTKEDFANGDETYDLIFDVLGMSSFARCKRVLNPKGTYLLASFKTKQLFQMLWSSRIGDKKVVCALSSNRPEDLDFIRERIEAGQITTVVDRCYPLAQTAEAHRYVETGAKKGHVVITVGEPRQG